MLSLKIHLTQGSYWVKIYLLSLKKSFDMAAIISENLENIVKFNFFEVRKEAKIY